MPLRSHQPRASQGWLHAGCLVKKENRRQHQEMVKSMAVITEKTFTIQVCRDT
eukprot:COSAG01_NODE_10108_length_2249_cov_1.036744_4_plen_52_part_01